MSARPRKLSQLSNDRRESARRQQSSPTTDVSLRQQLVLDDNVEDIEQHQNIISRFTVNTQQQQEPQPQHPEGRQILVPKSRVSKLKPAHRHLPTSRQVNQEGPVYNADGTLKMRRPILLLAEGERMSEADFGDLDIDITDSYVNDQGYDLVNQEVGSSYCQSFDLDMLPDAPERRMSPYNMSKKEDIVMKPLPDSSKQSVQKEDEDDGSMQVEVISSNEDVEEKEAKKKRSVEFYVKLLTRRSNSNHITPASSRPTSIAAVPVVAQSPDSITELPKQVHNEQVLSSTRQIRRRYTLPSENVTEKRAQLPEITADPLPRQQQQHIPLQVVAEDDSDSIKYASTSSSSSLSSSSASSLWSCHCCGVKVLVSESTDCLPSNCCWPITCCYSTNTPHSQPGHRKAASAVSRQQHVQPGGQVGSTDNKIFRSLTSSWAHIYRLPRRRRGRTSSRRSTNATKVRDAVVYPFRLGYNCLLWWLGPCISLGHECRGMCGSCHCCYYE